ncbi:MAG: beta-phosphoglucomutase [Erysipelotrichaceae bacterium]|nr:beta-phosphoglucomutase [Erysipelotrichaceae bacterium]
MKYKAIIFDLDGVICFTDHYHYLAWKKLADRFNIPFNEEDNNLLRGVSRAESLEIILRKHQGEPFSAEQKEKMLEEKNETYKEYLKQMSPKDLSEEVIFTLLDLLSEGYRIAIGSSSKNTKFILDRLGITKLFDAISDGTNITRSKPDPEVFLKAAEYLGLEPAECLVVEDAKAGIDAAKNGGFDSCGLLDARDYVNTTYGIDSFKQILDVVHNN